MKSFFDHFLVEQRDIFRFFDSVYLFGSCLWSSTPNDVDILLIYSSNNLDLFNFERCRVEQKLTECLQNVSIDLTVLSKAELQQTQFLRLVIHKKIIG